MNFRRQFGSGRGRRTRGSNWQQQPSGGRHRGRGGNQNYAGGRSSGGNNTLLPQVKNMFIHAKFFIQGFIVVVIYVQVEVDFREAEEAVGNNMEDHNKVQLLLNRTIRKL